MDIDMTKLTAKMMDAAITASLRRAFGPSRDQYEQGRITGLITWYFFEDIITTDDYCEFSLSACFRDGLLPAGFDLCEGDSCRI